MIGNEQKNAATTTLFSSFLFYVVLKVENYLIEIKSGMEFLGGIQKRLSFHVLSVVFIYRVIVKLEQVI